MAVRRRLAEPGRQPEWKGLIQGPGTAGHRPARLPARFIGRMIFYTLTGRKLRLAEEGFIPLGFFRFVFFVPGVFGDEQVYRSPGLYFTVYPGIPFFNLIDGHLVMLGNGG